ncbi:hypothetical protein EAO28_02875 [Klebsiella pneumoniae]|uniref:Uncharacterized protein n=1 Tax=Klebsiella pneumoniae TaxID=573 RepID=A0A3P2EIY5_KLEPN|nr:hypothetical protein EAO28_02875 [Klebsiella pneumoniae]RRF73712.1 hypothetical protein EAO30_09065 [Klebsiella pneumoniae]RRF75457.1 hypothetical protein EAO18_08130 [Klebsiella pneumoniae]
MKLRCAGVTKITQVIVTSCYIANNNFTFFKIYRQVKVLISGSEYSQSDKAPLPALWQEMGRRRIRCRARYRRSGRCGAIVRDRRPVSDRR